MVVYVLLYEVGKDSEGIHSIELNGITIVHMFEERDDAERYCESVDRGYSPLCIHDFVSYFNDNCLEYSLQKDHEPEYFKFWTIVNELPLFIYNNPNYNDESSSDNTLCIKKLTTNDYNLNILHYQRNRFTINVNSDLGQGHIIDGEEVISIENKCLNDDRCIKLNQ